LSAENVLLIGGNGFLGRHTAAALRGFARSVSVFDRPSSSHAARAGTPLDPTTLPQFEGSVTDRNAVANAITDSAADTIIVFASYGVRGLGLVKSAERNPAGAVNVNVDGLVNVLEAAAERRNCRVIWLSSTTVYGSAEWYSGRVDEHSLVFPQSIYGASKVLGEQLIRSYRRSRGVDAVAVRPTLVWGPGLTYTGVQSSLNELVEATTRREPASVAIGTEQWDLVYVKDVAEGLAWIARHPSEDDIMLLNGYTASLHDVEEAVRALCPGIEIRREARAPNLGVPLVDDSRLRAAGFTPRFDLHASIRDYLASLAATPQKEPHHG
jgi:nucleoside-diphosphate-sugar epimerase